MLVMFIFQGGRRIQEMRVRTWQLLLLNKGKNKACPASAKLKWLMDSGSMIQAKWNLCGKHLEELNSPHPETQKINLHGR